MIKAIMVEDEQDARENLQILLKTYVPQVEVAAILDTPHRLIEEIQHHNPQLLFLDIELGNQLIFEVLEDLPHLPFLIFTTGHSSYAIPAIKLQAVDYLLKPIDPDELELAIGKVEKNLEQQRKLEQLEVASGKIALNSKLGVKVERIDDLVYLEADSNYTHVYTRQNNKITVPYTLKRFEEALSKDAFIRVHHSFLVHVDAIKAFDTKANFILLIGEAKVPLSRSRKQQVKEALKLME